MSGKKKVTPVSNSQSALKSIVWRIMGVVVLATITWIYTHEWITVGLITVLHHATFLLVFYLHEKAWQKLPNVTGTTRNVLKAFIYEVILGMGIGGLIVLLVTGSWTKVTQITITYTIVKIIMYIIYDRIWSEFKK